MPKRTARTILWITLLAFLNMSVLANPEGFPGGGLKPVPGLVQPAPPLP